VTRRLLLLLLAASGGGGAAASRGRGAMAAAPARALLELFDRPARVQALGRAYLAGLQRPPSAAALARAIWQELDGAGPLRARVADLVRRDFAAGRVASANGWLLSQTEARLCALAVLAA
jgi:hypothetical protein